MFGPFQSLIGRLATVGEGLKEVVVVIFQSLIGRLATETNQQRVIPPSWISIPHR